MTTKPENPPAFPILHSIDGNWVREPISQYCGMTLRDYFAAAALQGMVGLMNPTREHIRDEHCACMAQQAYQYAVAMLAAREATND